ncbi:MAG: fatty acid--CoA ligase family protein [Deferrisomatales bacterium]
MSLDFLRERFRTHPHRGAVVWHDDEFTYGWLLDGLDRWAARLEQEGVAPGSVVALEADFSPNAVALFLALTERRCVVVPLTQAAGASREEWLDTAEAEHVISLDASDGARFTATGSAAGHELYAKLRGAGHPGLVLFSSGSTGKSKAAVHDLTRILAKFRVPRRSVRAITFLLYDHIGGVNTLLYTLSNGGCVITVQERTPDAVLRAVERHRATLLPTSPTFLNLVLLSGAYERYDLSSLEIVSYGTEPMPQSTLTRLHEVLPHVQLLQTYGLSEVGILRSKSRSSDSLWVKLGGEGFRTRVVDGILHIQAQSAMLGYLNAPSPFTEDGWFITGDEVEVDGEYFRILGRRSELINVGGEKVYPAEVESAIQEMPNVAEAVVYGEKHPLTGHIVCARVRLLHPEDRRAFALRLKKHCRTRLQRYKVPVKVEVVDQDQHGARFKKMRRCGQAGG